MEEDTTLDASPIPTAVITLEIVPLAETEDEYIVNASSDGLVGGEATLLEILKGFVATLEARAEEAQD